MVSAKSRCHSDGIIAFTFFFSNYVLPLLRGVALINKKIIKY